VVEEIEEAHQQRRPVLVGTTSIEKSEQLSEVLGRKGVPHQV
jgi:preprotein translocase subunit SecA